VPQDTPASLRLEETLGYFAEKNPTLGTLSRILADIRAWLREHIPLFKSMQLSANDLIRMVQGSVEAARKPAVRAAEGPPRYSKTAQGQGTPPVTRRQLMMDKRSQAITDKARAFDETVDPAAEAMQKRLLTYYNKVRASALTDKIQPWLDSPGLITARSQSKAARYLGGMLFESASGLGKRQSTVAIEYERMQLGYKWQALPQLKDLLKEGMTASERAQYLVGGGKAAEERIWRAVEVERQTHRNALRVGAKHTSTAPEYIQKAAKVVDDFYEKVVQDGLIAGNPLAGMVKGGGIVGHMPYEWQWEKISRMYRENPAQFNAFHENLVQQYTEQFVTPALDALLDKGPVTPKEMQALSDRLAQKVARVVDNKIRALMQDPESRLDGQDLRLEDIAADLLIERFEGASVTPEVIASFREKLSEIRQDRRRTELDLIREVNGVSLLDFIKYNAISQVTHGAHRWAGLNALARRGFVDIDDVQAALNAARMDGATPAENFR